MTKRQKWTLIVSAVILCMLVIITNIDVKPVEEEKEVISVQTLISYQSDLVESAEDSAKETCEAVEDLIELQSQYDLTDEEMEQLIYYALYN